MKGKLAAGLAGLLVLGAAGAGAAQGTGGPVMPQPTGEMMQMCAQMMAQMGGMGGMAPQPQPPEGREPTEHGTKQAGGLAVTLLSAPPLSPEAMQKMMPGMGGMKGMQGMEGMMPGMGGMGAPQPTHWIGVVVRDAKTDGVVQGLQVTLTALKGGVTRTVKLMPMPGSYGTNISLPEKGRYTVTVSIARPGQPVSLAFDFEYE